MRRCISIGKSKKKRTIYYHTCKVRKWQVDMYLWNNGTMNIDKGNPNQALFKRADDNGDGILSLQEFKTIVQEVEPTTSDFDIISLYDLISGEDGVIDKEEFAIGMDFMHK